MALTLRKHGRIWYARGTVQMRSADGSIYSKRIEDSTGEESKAKAARIADLMWNYYQEAAYKPKPKLVTFADAAITYTETKQPSKRDRQFLKKLVEHFGDTPISAIDQAAIAEACTALYPEAKASTLHRAVYAPVSVVLNLSGHKASFEKPKIEKALVSIPNDAWFDKVLKACTDVQLEVLLTVLTTTGRRPSEVLGAIYNGDGTATIGRDKSGKTILIHIPYSCLVCNLKKRGRFNPTEGERLFTYGSRQNVYKVLRPVCDKAGVKFFGLHAIGRHTAATRLLKAGYSTKFVAEALGWSSTRMVDLHYGHLSKSEVSDQARKVSDEWLSQRTK